MVGIFNLIMLLVATYFRVDYSGIAYKYVNAAFHVNVIGSAQ
jgi:hypothetical protein